MSKHRAVGIAVAIVALAGCDRVFGLESRTADAGIDQAIVVDAAPAVISIDPVTDVAINETIAVSAQIVGPPNTAATYSFTATRGTYDQAIGVDLIGPTGELTVTVMYTSPTTPGNATLGVDVAGTSETTAIDVLTRSFEGNDIQLAGTSQWGGSSLYATPITVTRAGTLRSIGMRNTRSVANVRFALYRDDATRTKILETGPQPVGAGRTEVPAPREIIMTTGRYWIGATFDTNALVVSGSGGSEDILDIRSHIFSLPFPPDLTATSRSTGRRYAMFIELAYSSGL